MFLGSNENLLVRHGDLLNVSCECRNNALHFRCNRIARSSQVVRSPLSSNIPSSTTSSSGNVITVHDLQRQYSQPFTLYSSGDPMMSSTVVQQPHVQGCNSAIIPQRERISSNPSMEHSATYDVDFPPLLKPSISASNLGTGYDDNNVPAFLSSSQRLVPVPLSNKLSFFLERTEISFLNDLDYNRMLCKALATLRDNFQSPQDFRIIDISQGISLIPLQAVKIGAQEVCIVQSETNQMNQELLCYLTTVNGIDPQRITFTSQSIEECETPEWGVMVTADIVETCGCLRQQVLDDIALARWVVLNSIILLADLSNASKVYFSLWF